MKKAIFTFLAVAGFGLASAQTISFDKTTLEYGNVKAGSDGHRVFTVKNTGAKPLILNDIKPQCGCTTPEWSKDPILPGKTGQIKVAYDTKIKGTFKKLIEVFSNDPDNNRSVIWIEGNVIDDANVSSQKLNATSAKAVSLSATQASVQMVATEANQQTKTQQAAKKK